MNPTVPAHTAGLLFTWLLRVTSLLCPQAPLAHQLQIVEAILAVTDDPAEAALLAVVDAYETGFGQAGVRFGLVTRCVRARLRGQPLVEYAETARDSLRVGARLCGARWQFHWYHTGECPCLRRGCPHALRPTRFSEQEYARWRKVLVRAGMP